MSVAVMSRVWADPPVGGSQLLVLLALADNADEDRRMAWPSVATLARKTKMSDRSVQRALRELTADGVIRVVRAGGRGPDPSTRRATVYELFPAGGRQSVTDDTGGQETVTPVSPQPSVEPSSPPEGRETGAREPKINGKPVKSNLWRRTVQVLDVFNAKAGTKLGPLTGTGQPSESAKRIYGRIVAWPDLDVAAHTQIIERTLASRWWGEDRPSVGVIYGPKVFEQNMERDGRPPAPAPARRRGREGRMTAREMHERAEQLRKEGR